MPSAKTQANSEYAQRGEYAQRIDRVIDYLRRNLDRPVKLAELADVACFSECHFHRIFTAVSGETVNSFTNRLRLEKAARLLRYSEPPALEVFLDKESPEDWSHFELELCLPLRKLAETRSGRNS